MTALIDPKKYSETVDLLRSFFLSKNFLEVHTQNRLSILAACEDPETVATYEYNGQVWPLPQTGQMWLEYELLSNPSVEGFFCVSTSYRAEPNPVEGRHETIFPMFEFEMKGGVEELAEDPRFISFLCGSHNDLDNWFRPQIDFLSNTTYIWKYKDGFGSHFSLWMSNILGVPFIIHDVPYEKVGPENHRKVKVNARIIDNIRRFYGDDYAQLDSSLQKGEKTKT